MHFEVLVEDRSGSIAVELFLEKILGNDPSIHSWRIRAYSGIGRLPKDLRSTGGTDKKKRLLLNRLPQLLRGHGKSLQDNSAVIVVVDLDTKNCLAFKQELLDKLAECNPLTHLYLPRTLFRIAIEESEAWLLGDRNAVKSAYPKARDSVLNDYKQDSICGTWEVLADAVHPEGSKLQGLKKVGYPEVGIAKCDWARAIAPHINVDQNQSKSFQVFRDGIRKLAGIE